MNVRSVCALFAMSCVLGSPGVGFATDPPPPPPPPIEEAPADEGTVDMRGAMKRYDFDQGNQYLWGAIGGVGGSILLGAAGAGAGALMCRDRGPECGSATGLLFAMGWATGLIAGPLVAINMTGGQRANGWTHTASVGGIFLGVLAVGVVSSVIYPQTGGLDGLSAPQSIALGAAYVALIGASAGLGAAWGYQAAYPEIRQFTVAPMILPEGGGGLVFGGRF